MLKLGGRVIKSIGHQNDRPNEKLLYKLSTDAQLPSRIASSMGFLSTEVLNEIPEQFAHVFTFEEHCNHLQIENLNNISLLSTDFSYLEAGDVVRLEPDRQRIRVLFRKSSPHNTILLTEQCNHYCLMCSQPPKDIDDSWLLDEARQLVRMIPSGVTELGFSGGEPTLYGDGFIDIINLTANHLPGTAIHILSNGRKFADESFTIKYAAIEHIDKMVGIPIYSDNPTVHDYVVQAEGAFDETIRGILNLKRYGQKVEIRVVIHKQTIESLVSLAEFLTRNLLFADHVALMGLEITGFTRANLPILWVDPYDYQTELAEAVSILESSKMTVSLYNLPLCLVPVPARGAYRKSISDWKNEYLDECEPCTRKNDCGGFFSSGVKYKHSAHIRPFT